jgi:hypothetical protein
VAVEDVAGVLVFVGKDLDKVFAFGYLLGLGEIG